MSKSRKSLIKPRAYAFSHQNGYCYYCNQPMWLTDPLKFSRSHNITLAQAKRYQCTGEHLLAHQNGGTSARNNIVAACLFCNQQRHRKKIILAPELFKQFIQKRMQLGRWHIFRLTP